MDQLLLGLDIGTTAAKAALFTPPGRLLAVGQAEHPLHHPRPGWAEQNPDDWWRSACLAIRQALAQVANGPERVAGLAVSSQAPTMLALDSAGDPLRPALIWMDRRADAQAVQLREAIGPERIVEVTGNRADPFYVAAKIRWFRQHEPHLFARTRYFVQANGYVSFRLTGELALDNVHAGLLQLRDWREDGWSDQLCRLCGVSSEQFPPIRPGHALLGQVTRQGAEASGLMPGTPVMVGTVDGAAAAIEAGVAGPGLAAEMTGASTVLLIPNQDGLVEPAFIAMPHALPGLHLLLGALASSGASLRWFRNQLSQAELARSAQLGVDAYDLLTQQAATAPPGSDGVIFLPYMMGERSPLWDSNARGIFFGLSLATERGGLVRAILEGTAFALRHNVEVARQAGVELAEIRSVGGGTRSPLWNQIKADVLGLPILLPETSAGAAFGAAILAGMGLGLYPDVVAALGQMIQIRDRYEPDPQRHAFYSELYLIFRNIYDRLKDDFDRIAAILERERD